MSLIIISKIVFSISLFGVIFIFLRNLPLIPDYKPEYVPKEKRFFFRFRKNVSEKKIKTAHKTQKVREKIIHRLRIIILKIDNALLSYFHKLRERRMHLEKVYFVKRERKGKIKIDKLGK
jgi:hypothetical protein